MEKICIECRQSFSKPKDWSKAQFSGRRFCTRLCSYVFKQRALIDDAIGTRINRLTCIDHVGSDKHGNLVFLFKCVCGSTCKTTLSSVKKGNTKSCGCLYNESRALAGRIGGANTRKHGMTGDPFLYVWIHIKERCSSTKAQGYHLYGGRGITCEWRSFEEFKNDMYDSYKAHVSKFGYKQTQIDRKNVNGNYSKDNCRWATRKEQGRNKRTNRMLTFNDETLCVAEWAERLSLNAKNIYNRLDAGWSPERALTTPVNSR